MIMAEVNTLGLFHIGPCLTAFIFEPFMKPLNGKTSRSQTHSDRLGCKTFVEKKNAFFTPLFDVSQCVLVLVQQSCDQARSQQQSPQSFLQHVCDSKASRRECAYR